MSESFTFDGRNIPFRAGQSLAAALTGAGERRFRDTASGAPRSIFCGMGVCQDCLVTVDGAPNQRACMTPARPGQRVEPQAAFPRLDPSTDPPTPAGARVMDVDVAVIGAGAGGLSAAIEARRAGADVVVLDERHVGGGQYYKQSADSSLLDDQQADGAALIRTAEESGAEILSGVELWGAFDGPLFLADQDGRALVVRAKAAVVATGAHERPRMVPGWTLPGVMTTGAAQTLWRSYRTLPGQRVLVCGSGPLNAQVALELAEGGADVVLVAESAPPPWRRPADALRMVAADPALAAKGLGVLRRLRRRDVPVRYGTHLQTVERAKDRLRATLTDGVGQTRHVDVDVVCMNDGFEPQNEVLRLLGADMTYDAAFGHLRCDRSPDMATTVPGLFAAGDCAGLGGAPAARVEGRIAGRAAAAYAGRNDFPATSAADAKELRRHRNFQKHLWRLFDVGPRPLDGMSDDTMVCRCEEITLGQARAGIGGDTAHIGTLKRATRLGMGRCQGRYCGPVAARLVAHQTGQPIENFSHFAPRVPIKPVSIAAILAAQEALDDGD